ncbi:flagellar microtugule protofilament ribbon protein, putative [Ichthyophthirius multifiliis]|uniref:Flagellar microtugule protofilament ribbon protein, putative n=1 Tax=Ichthyophthirius multifiliis TaxID=5932 RepID=G0R5D8_ICHMU|nr:flagellar microtugule protofilament ribbon protein, putative [Ichthyophthirius multifiliis]EGR27327.1 flagellar microtugule protofilament ribbon protein, putative [Ichthyophthirius multifiliis]|eukprot:XP_004024211.1 flagellar microtugule protofilament ribbon protein, putative [Ichthyophthirius multifiliis]
MINLNLPKTVPLLPGHCFPDFVKEAHNKTQQFSLINKIPQEKTNYIEEKSDQFLVDNLRMGTPLNLTYGKNRQVLKFMAYFQESVVENPNENYRIRKCAIYFYLSDGTMHINEPRVSNSGIQQGVFVKRQKIPKQLNSTESYYQWEDLNLGINLNFFERVFRIFDCDAFTREFYDYMGVTLNEPESMPKDCFEVQRQLKDLKIPPPDTKEYNEYNEVKLGGGHPNGGLKQYIENDRKVLSFNILWNDISLEGGLNYFVLNYFLADNQIEIKEIIRHNSGKDPFPLLLNRKRLPKEPILTHYPGMTLKKEEFYSPIDLICGKLIRIYSKDCLIYDCDPFTKEWYLQNLNLQQMPITLKKEDIKKFYQPVPPYHGYGSEEDSLGSVYSLQPKPPRKDINKMHTQDQYILRFEARLISQNKEDNNRRFIISFYCGDDTVMAYEICDKNSGIWGGKFLERMLHKSPISGKYYNEIDFQIGELIQLGAYQFQLLRADEYTHKYMKSKPEVFREADIEQVLIRLKKFASKYNSYENFLIDIIKHVDKNNKGIVEFNDLVVGMKKLGFNLTYQEIYTLMRYFNLTEDWKLCMKELYVSLGGKR